MSVVHFEGGVRSGIKMTSEEDTIYGIWATLSALADQGLPWKEWPTSSHFRTWHQGDDTRVDCDQELDQDQWSASYARFGFKCKLEFGDVFLAKHRRGDIAGAPIAARIVQQTMSNEKEPTGHQRDIDGLLTLGFIARTEGAEKLDPALTSQALRSCLHAEWWPRILESGLLKLTQTPGQTLAQARSTLASSPRAQASMIHALHTAAGESWLAETVREAEHSTVAQAALELAASLGITPDVTTQDLLLARLTARVVARLERDGRRSTWAQQALIRGYDAVLSGQPAREMEWLKWIEASTVG
jgi:hypothetical protein